MNRSRSLTIGSLLFLTLTVLGGDCRNLEYYHVEEAVRAEMSGARFSCRAATQKEIQDYCWVLEPGGARCNENFILIWLGTSIPNRKRVETCRLSIASDIVPAAYIPSDAGGFPYQSALSFERKDENTLIFQNECYAWDLGAAGGWLRSDYYKLSATIVDGQMNCEVKPFVPRKLVG